MENIGNDLKDKPDQELIYQTYEFYLPRYKRLLDQMSEMPLVYYLPKGVAFAKKNIRKIKFSSKTFNTHLFVNLLPNGDKEIELQYKVEDQTYSQDKVNVLNTALILVDDVLYAAQDEKTVKTIAQLNESNDWHIAAKDWDDYLEQTLVPQIQHLSIDFDAELKLMVDGVNPIQKIVFSEHENNLVFKPVFDYHGVNKYWLEYSPAIIAEKGKVVMIERNEAVEQTLLTFLRHAHESMQESRKSASFMIHSDVALKGKWYFTFLEQLQEMGIIIEGYEQLKEIKINPNKPITNIQITSGIDWFDAVVEVQFGDNVVKIVDIKKAMTNRQSHVKLKDGTIGILTDEWKEQYGLMFKMGEVNKDGASLRLKQVHFSVIDTLSLEATANPSLLHLAEKRDKLNSFDFDKHLEDVSLPGNVNATLRPYQQAGYKWFQFLEETGWGGILADDMGLGKTLQTLTFMQSIYNKNNKSRFLVVCPTSLMYNWESELLKFTPDMTYHIHHGTNRNQYDIVHSDVNVLITSYGTLRSDIKKLVDVRFDYVILDESQAIKNPLSQVAKAALLINAENRIALSGTPIQNNTFDLYAQMNFLNPGMLGSMEFFKSEFATPIDKMQDAEAKMHLKKLINPFLLRRTKEQVAPDLPAKSEMIMYCEMGSKQRKIYDAYKNSFRAQILGEIEEKGIGRSQMSILTGLTKLRQICDSPAILKGEEYENHSVKIEEIAREMADNMQGHKALVFSQFLGMLSLIKDELEKQKIPYVYFDGSTTSTEREKAIQRFQHEDDCRVFLISLKAGGVGLNLTAADYVYLVDPWWNPAVEQQAIDRTHRIGQTKNIFAYRMICKDTIEEKIMKLQERKLGLVKDLISEENAFLKKLTREDVEYLLS
jgi:SNF2 family DNA or RNA helicase